MVFFAVQGFSLEYLRQNMLDTGTLQYPMSSMLAGFRYEHRLR
jgi:hypothetical protein